VESNTDHREHEEAIAPVKPPFSSAAGGSAPVLGEGDLLFEPSPRLTRALVWGAGALLVVGVLGVFFVLPRLVGSGNGDSPQSSPAAAASPPAPAEPPKPELTEQQLAELADRTESLLAELLTQQQQLNEMSAESWGGESWSRYEQAAKSGDDAYLAKAYQDAVTAYTQALDIGKGLLEQSSEITHRALEAGQQALEVGNSKLALEQFDLVLKVEPDNDAAKAGRARAEKLPDVLDLGRRGDELRQQGKLAEAAESYRKALAIDAAWKPAADALGDVEHRIADQQFETLMSKAFSALSSERYEDAEQGFKAALAMRPNAAEAKDGLVQARQGLALDKIALAQARGAAFEKRELWDRAIDQYESALAADKTLVFAKEGLERSRSRAALDAKLSNLIANPTLLFRDDVLEGARMLLEQAHAIPEPGSRLNGQIDRLTQLIAAATTPVTVELRSDAQTEVTLYRVGHLGVFTAKQVELRPGEYTAVGSRDGYRDVRETFTVLPGSTPAPVNVVCSETI
jgi:tetratricopeptide (TPR) repeat protein